MFIQKLALTNFKRFSDLVIENIPSRTKLVLLIGSNGSGKSSVFDAFDWISKGVLKKNPSENLEEFYASAQKPYDKNRYIQAIQAIRDKKKAHIASGIAKARDGYPFFKENERNKNFSEQLHRFKNNTHVIVDMLESEDFETFFKVLSAKDHGKTLPERQNLSRAELARTRWFRQKIEKSINP